MGVYYCAVNVDKREYVDAHRLGGGAKFRENFNVRGLAGAVYLLLTPGEANWPEGGRWAGDRVVIADDAGTPRASDYGFTEGDDMLYDYAKDQFTDISKLVLAGLQEILESMGRA
jgi:hypothetical protein